MTGRVRLRLDKGMGGFLVFLFMAFGLCGSHSLAAVVSKSELIRLGAQQGIQIEFPVFPDSPAEVARLTRSARLRFKNSVAAIEKLPADQVSFSSTVVAFDSAFNDLGKLIGLLMLVSNFSEDTGLGRSAEKAIIGLYQELNRAYSSPTLFAQFSLFKSFPGLSAEQRRLLEVLLAGFYTTPEKAKDRIDSYEIAGILDGLSKDESQFGRASARRPALLFNESELAGIQAEDFQKLDKKGSKIVLNLENWNEFNLAVSYCHSASTRKRVWAHYYMGAPAESSKLLETMVAARTRVSHRSGYSSWAAMQLEGLTNTPAGVSRAFRSFREKSEEKFQNEKDLLAEALGFETEASDVAYAARLLREKQGISEAEVRQYFPYPVVLQRFFTYLEELFDLEFKQVSDSGLWEGSETYALFEKGSGKILGVFALDPYPRKHKNGWFHIQSYVTGARAQAPFASVNLNFPPPSDGKPSLLSLGDVATLFHEGGHLIHYLLSKQSYATLGPDSTNQDLSEFPSTFFELLSMEPEMLRFISSHSESGEPLPEAMAKVLSASNGTFLVHRLRQKMAQAAMDLALHSARPPKLSLAEQNAFETYYYPLPADGSFAGSFGYLSGYDAFFWTYLFAEGLAAEALKRFRSSPRGVFDRSSALLIREGFLEAGGTQSSAEVLSRVFKDPPAFCSALLERAGLGPSSVKKAGPGSGS